MKNSQKKLVQGGALDARKKLGEKVNSPGPGPIFAKQLLVVAEGRAMDVRKKLGELTIPGPWPHIFWFLGFQRIE